MLLPMYPFKRQETTLTISNFFQSWRTHLEYMIFEFKFVLPVSSVSIELRIYEQQDTRAHIVHGKVYEQAILA